MRTRNGGFGQADTEAVLNGFANDDFRVIVVCVIDAGANNVFGDRWASNNGDGCC